MTVLRLATSDIFQQRTFRAVLSGKNKKQPRIILGWTWKLRFASYRIFRSGTGLRQLWNGYVALPSIIIMHAVFCHRVLSSTYLKQLVPGRQQIQNTNTVLSAFSAHLRIRVEFKNVDWTKLKFYLYQND